MEVVSRMVMIQPSAVLALPQPVQVFADDAQRGEQVVQQAVIGVEHPFPDDRDRDRAGDDRQIEHAAEEGRRNFFHLIDQRGHPQREQAGERHADQHDDKGIGQRLIKFGILKKSDIVIQSDEGEFRQRIAEGAVDQTHHHRENDEAEEEQQRRSHEQIAGDVLRRRVLRSSRRLTVCCTQIPLSAARSRAVFCVSRKRAPRPKRERRRKRMRLKVLQQGRRGDYRLTFLM